jgi:drug/metabolite transporter (DMT)-like permease
VLNKKFSGGDIEALFAVLLWSTVATAFKLTLRFVKPSLLLLIASTTSLAVLYIFYSRERARRVSLFPYLLLGFLNPFLYYSLLFEAYNRLPAHQALLLNYTWPIFLGLFTSIFLSQPLRRRDVLGLFVGFWGVIVLKTEGNIKNLRFSEPTGSIIALLSAVVWGLFWSLSLKIEGTTREKLFFAFLCGTPLIYLRTLIFERPESLPLKGLFGSIYVGLFEMSLTFLLWHTALKKSRRVSRALSYAYLIPIISLLFISLVLKERLHPTVIIALLLILSAILLVRRERVADKGDTG